MSDTVYQGTLTGSDGSVWTVKDARLTTAPTTTTPVPTTPIVGKPNRVVIGTADYPLTAVNPTSAAFPGGRGADQLTAYQKPVGITTTNAYGAEVTVVNGQVTSVTDRLVTKQAGGVTVPANGYVLSGHGSARDWLLANARTGAKVQLVALDTSTTPTGTTPTGTPTGTTPTDTTPSTTGGGAPPWVVGGYWQMYTGPRVGAISAGYNICWAAFAFGGGGANMTFAPGCQDEASFISEVTAAKKRGVIWGVSLGGGVPANVATVLRTEADAQRCFDTLVPIIDKFGFQAVDYDLENGPAGFTGDALLSLAKKLKAKYGPQFVISMVPRPYEAFAIDIAAQLHNAGVLDLLMFQFYDAPETRDTTFLTAWIPRILDQAKAKGVPYNKMVVGAITYAQYPYGWNKIDVYRSIIADMRTSRGIRGAFIWETSLDEKEGWSFAQQVAAIAR